MEKPRSRHVKLDEAVPTKVSDMKDGELRISLTGIYGRVGNQILFADWVTDIHFDEFEDGTISPKWDILGEQGDPGSTLTEENGVLRFSMTPRISVTPYLWLAQENVEAIDWAILGEGVWDFDVWWKLVWPTGLASATGDVAMDMRMEFTGGGPFDGAGWELSYNQALDLFYLTGRTAHDGLGYSNTPGSNLSEAAGGRYMWLRLRFKPGSDSRIKLFYHHGPENPQYAGWDEITSPKYNPDPTGHTNLEIELKAGNADLIARRDLDFHFMGDYKEAPTTTTTTTT